MAEESGQGGAWARVRRVLPVPAIPDTDVIVGELRAVLSDILAEHRETNRMMREYLQAVSELHAHWHDKPIEVGDGRA